MSEQLGEETSWLEASAGGGISFEVGGSESLTAEGDKTGDFHTDGGSESVDTEFPIGAYSIEPIQSTIIRVEEADASYEAARFKRSRHGRGVRVFRDEDVALRLLSDEDFARTA